MLPREGDEKSPERAQRSRRRPMQPLGSLARVRDDGWTRLRGWFRGASLGAFVRLGQARYSQPAPCGFLGQQATMLTFGSLAHPNGHCNSLSSTEIW